MSQKNTEKLLTKQIYLPNDFILMSQKHNEINTNYITVFNCFLNY